MNYIEVEKYGIYTTNLNFNEEMYNNIVEEMYDMENQGEKYSGASRTFKLHNGFHSCNLLDKSKVDLEKYSNTSILISRVQELLHNAFDTKILNFSRSGFCIHIKEIWFNILRKNDYNMPHNHPGNSISGNFYLKVPKLESKVSTDGTLVFIKKSSHHTYVPASVYNPSHVLTDSMLSTITPSQGLGVLFQSHLKHIVMPHFTDEDRIGIAFNASVVPCLNFYANLYPKPYWNPNRITIRFEEEPETKNGCLQIDLVNGSSIPLRLSSLKDKDGFNINNSSQLVNQNVTLDQTFMKQYCGYKNYSIDWKKYFDFADDYFTSMHSDLWKPTDTLYFEENDSETLVVVFSGMGINNTPPTFIFHKTLLKYKCDKLFLRDFNRSWFMSGSKGSKPIENVMRTIRNHTHPRHKRIVAIGASSGGYNSILLGHMMGMQECVAFAPQTVINPHEMKQMGDGRWREASERVFRNTHKNDRKYLDLRNITSSKNFRMKTTIYVSNEMDERHADRISNGNTRIEKIVIDTGNKYKNTHLTALIMKEKKILQKVFDELKL